MRALTFFFSYSHPHSLLLASVRQLNQAKGASRSPPGALIVDSENTCASPLTAAHPNTWWFEPEHYSLAGQPSRRPHA